MQILELVVPALADCQPDFVDNADNQMAFQLLQLVLVRATGESFQVMVLLFSSLAWSSLKRKEIIIIFCAHNYLCSKVVYSPVVYS